MRRLDAHSRAELRARFAARSAAALILGGASAAACSASGGSSGHLSRGAAGAAGMPGAAIITGTGAGGSLSLLPAGGDGGMSAAGAGNVRTEASGSDGPQTPFPASPVLDMNVPANVPLLFQQPEAGGEPCVVEPEESTLIPNNWVRPRFRFLPTAGQNVFEIRLHVDGEPNDLLAYTTRSAWPLPKEYWAYLAHRNDQDLLKVAVSMRAAVYAGGALSAGPSAAAKRTLLVAPAPARGNVVYWNVTYDTQQNQTTALKGFQPGAEGVGTVLLPAQVQMPEAGSQKVTCIGCHVSTPGGEYASFATGSTYGLGLASVQGNSVGAAPPWLGTGALAVMQTKGFKNGLHAYSKAHFSAGDRIAIAPLTDRLAWIDLEAQSADQGTAYDYLARTGDPEPASGAPAWSNDGKTIVYDAAPQLQDGRLGSGTADLYSIPYADRKGGNSTPIPGASDPLFDEYYPSFSPDDTLLAFTRAPKDTYMYDALPAEIFVIPSAGGTATRVRANDPPACVALVTPTLSASSPGVGNNYPRWAPEARPVNGKTYQWLAFTSRRDGDLDPRRENSGKKFSLPQIVIVGVVTEGATITTYGGLYAWNQSANESNHTPAWDVFDIPNTPPPPPPPPPPVVK